MKINLVDNGIFPITVGLDGKPLNNNLDTNYSFSGTVQGEGKLMGVPSLFIRTSACNLRCIWFNKDNQGSPCDTPYSSHKAEKNQVEIDDIITIVNNNTDFGRRINHIIISGGEPTMHTEALGELLNRLQSDGYHTTIETNGTIYDDKIARHTNLLSISPKLANSIPTKDKFIGKEVDDLKLTYSKKWEDRHNKTSVNIDVLQKYIDSCYLITTNAILETRHVDYRSKLVNKDFQLKFVVSNNSDIEEVTKVISQLNGVNPTDVTLMPEGYFSEDIAQKTPWLVEKCVETGYRFTTRFHTLLYGTLRGV